MINTVQNVKLNSFAQAQCDDLLRKYGIILEPGAQVRTAKSTNEPNGGELEGERLFPEV